MSNYYNFSAVSFFYYTSVMAFYLAIDQGTHSSRAILFDDKGRAVASESEIIQIRRFDSHCVEQSAEEILQSVQTVIRACLASLSSSQRKDILSCGLCTQRSTVVQMDQDGTAISPALSWQDTRGARWLHCLSSKAKLVQSISGLPMTPHYGASKIRWLDRHNKIPDGKSLFTPLAGYLISSLVAGNPHCVDHCNAQRTQLMDLETRQWSSQLLKLFELEHVDLPECVPVCFDYGELLNTGIPLRAVSGDQNSTAFGSGELPEDEALVNFGSGAFVLRAESELVKSEVQLNSIGYSTNNAITWLKEGTINGCGTALSWASEQWGLGDMRKNLSSWINTVEQPGIFINSVGGIGSPWWQSEIAPEFIDLGSATKGARAVAVLESILFLVMDNLSLMRQHSPVKRLRVSGGLSLQDGLCQKLANLSQLEVSRLHNPEATARGIAWLAAGRPDDWITFPSDTFFPHQDTALASRYNLFTTELRKRLT